MRFAKKSSSLALLSILLATALFISGCAPLLIAGGAVGGYAIAKNSSDTGSSTKK